MAEKPNLPDGLAWRGDLIHIDTTVGGHRISRSCRTANVVQARQLLDTIRGQVRMAELTGIEARIFREQKPLDRFITEEMERMEADHLRARTLVKYRHTMASLSRFLSARHGREAQVEDLNQSAIVAFKDDRMRTPRARNGHRNGIGRLPSVRTVANELDVIRVFCRRAVKRGLLTADHEGVPRPRGAYAPRVRWLDDPELISLVTAAATWDTWAHDQGQKIGALYALVLEMYLRTGLRLDELRHLTIERTRERDGKGRRVLVIEEDERSVQVLVPQRTKVMGSTDGARQHSRCLPAIYAKANASAGVAISPHLHVVPMMLSWKPKTRGRRIPLSPKAEAVLGQLLALRSHWLAHGDGLWALRRQHRLQEPPWLIPDATGVPWRFKMARIMAKCSAQAGITPVVHTHDLRHTFATHLRRSGVPIESLKELLGHANIEETLIYAHVTPTESARAIDLIDRVDLRFPETTATVSS